MANDIRIFSGTNKEVEEFKKNATYIGEIKYNVLFAAHYDDKTIFFRKKMIVHKSCINHALCNKCKSEIDKKIYDNYDDTVKNFTIKKVFQSIHVYHCGTVAPKYLAIL